MKTCIKWWVFKWCYWYGSAVEDTIWKGDFLWKNNQVDIVGKPFFGTTHCYWTIFEQTNKQINMNKWMNKWINKWINKQINNQTVLIVVMFGVMFEMAVLTITTVSGLTTTPFFVLTVSMVVTPCATIRKSRCVELVYVCWN